MKKITLCTILLVNFLFNIANANDRISFEIPRTEIISIQDTGTNREYELHIKLPLNYSTDKQYPVVYITDSLYAFQIVSGATRYPINFNRMNNLMLVGISWEKDSIPALSRQRDYTPTVDSTNSFKDPTGEANKHLAFIKNDVIKYIEDNYSTDTKNRTYIGNSFGGLFGAYILFNEPELFKHYILGSPSFWYDNEMIFDFESRYFKKNKALNANIFIAVGALEKPPYTRKNGPDMVELAKRFHSQLDSRSYTDLSLKLIIIEEANHSTAFPTTAIQGLWWLFNIYDGQSIEF